MSPIAVLSGFAAARFGDRGTLVFDMIEVPHVRFAIVGYIMKVAPIGAFGAMGFAIGKYGIASLLQLGAPMATFCTTCLVFAIAALGAIAGCHGFPIVRPPRRRRAADRARDVSSGSVRPSMMAKLENLGVRKSTVGVVIPTGHSFDLDGTSIYPTMAAMFVAQATDPR